MKILHCVQNFFPGVGGMEEAVLQISRGLVSKGHEVTVMTTKRSDRTSQSVHGVSVVDFEIAGNYAQGISGDVSECVEFIKSTHFDIITLFAAQQWACDIFFKENLLEKVSAKLVFVPTGFSGLFQKQYQDYFSKMANWLLKFDMNVFLSDNYRDIEFARKNSVTKIKLIPNGASRDEFFPLNERSLSRYPAKLNLVHIGNHTGQKGHHELFKIFDGLNLKNIELNILGRSKILSRCYLPCLFKSFFYNLKYFVMRNSKKIKIKNLQRGEVVSLLKQSDLFILPSNIECSPIVLFEAMAAGLPFASSDVGNVREIIKWGEGGFLLPTTIDQLGRSVVDIEESTSLVEEILTDSDKWKKYSQSGYHSWIENFTWEKIASEYEKMYLELI